MELRNIGLRWKSSYLQNSDRRLELLGRSTGLILLAYLLSIAPYIFQLIGAHGLVDSTINEQSARSGIPKISWIAKLLALDYDLLVKFFLVIVVILSAARVAGWSSRIISVLLWISFNISRTAFGFLFYGAQEFINIALFYSIFANSKAIEKNAKTHFNMSDWSLFCLQIHLGIAYTCSGIEKARGGDWWTGESIWRSIYRNDPTGIRLIDLHSLAYVPGLFMMTGWIVIILELLALPMLSYERTQRIWAAPLIIMHLSIALFLGLWFFSAVMVTILYFGYMRRSASMPWGVSFPHCAPGHK